MKPLPAVPDAPPDFACFAMSAKSGVCSNWLSATSSQPSQLSSSSVHRVLS